MTSTFIKNTYLKSLASTFHYNLRQSSITNSHRQVAEWHSYFLTSDSAVSDGSLMMGHKIAVLVTSPVASCSPDLPITVSQQNWDRRPADCQLGCDSVETAPVC